MEDFMPGDGGGGGADSMDGVGAIANNRSSVAVKEQLCHGLLSTGFSCCLGGLNILTCPRASRLPFFRRVIQSREIHRLVTCPEPCSQVGKRRARSLHCFWL